MEEEITITFKVDMNIPMMPSCYTLQDSLHEALCKAIHEQDQEAINWLTDNINNIT